MHENEFLWTQRNTASLGIAQLKNVSVYSLYVQKGKKQSSISNAVKDAPWHGLVYIKEM